MVLGAFLIDEKPGHHPQDAQRTHDQERRAPPESQEEHGNKHRCDHRAHRCGGSEDALRESAFFLREPLGIGLGRPGPRPRFAQTEQHAERDERLESRGERRQRVGTAPQQRREREAAARAHLVVDAARDKLAHAVGHHEEHGDDGQQAFRLPLLLLQGRRGVDKSQLLGDAAVAEIFDRTVRQHLHLVGRKHLGLAADDRFIACRSLVVAVFARRAYDFGVGHPHVVERAAVEVVDDGHHHDQPQHDPSESSDLHNALLFKKIFAVGREGVDQNARFETDAPVELVGRHVVAVAGFEDAFPVADGQFEPAAGHVGGLAVEVFVEGADGTLVETDLDDHQLTVVAHDLTGDARCGMLPLHLVLQLECFAACFHCFMVV